MDPNTSKTNAAKAGTTGAEQSLSPQTNVTKATSRTNAGRGSTQKQGASLSPPANQQAGRQTARGRSNSS